MDKREKTKVEAAVQTTEIELEPGKKIKIGSGLETVFQKELLHLLKDYADVFAWSP